MMTARIIMATTARATTAAKLVTIMVIAVGIAVMEEVAAVMVVITVTIALAWMIMVAMMPTTIRQATAQTIRSELANAAKLFDT